MAPRQLASLHPQKVIYAALIGNILVAATKFIAAGLTGGSAMLSEAIHSVVDSGNSLLLLYGLHRAKELPDEDHPLGYGREIYFWSFVVAVLVFALGAGISLYEGIAHVLNPEPMHHPAVNYAVLGFSAIFDGATWWIALSTFKGRMRYRDLFRAIRKSKDPPSFMVLFEDSAALIGLIIAFAGTYFSVRLELPVLDGVASILIGLLLAATAALLALETKGLLIGESADQPIVDSIMRIATKMDGVDHANGIITVHLAPRQIVVALSLEFADELKTPDIEVKVVELERRLRHMHPTVIALFVKPQSSSGYKQGFARRHGKLGEDNQCPSVGATNLQHGLDLLPEKGSS
jgi:cation diffusion facilitator family transporter